MSPRRNPSGMWSCSKSKLRPLGSFGLRRCRCRLATRARYSSFGRHSQRTSFRSSKRTFSAIEDAGLKMSTDALALTFVVIVAANSTPTSVAWLWAFEPR